MAKEKTESKLKLIHLVYLLVAAAISVGIVYGAMQNQQGNNTKDIEKMKTAKVEKEYMVQHETQQREQFIKIDKTLDKVIVKLDAILAK